MPQKIGLIQPIGADPTAALVAVLGFRPHAVAALTLRQDAADAQRVESAARLAGLNPRSARLVVGRDWSAARVSALVTQAVEALRSDRETRVLVQLTGVHEVLFAGSLDAAKRLGLDAFTLDLPSDDEDGVPQVVPLGTPTAGAPPVAALFHAPIGRLSIPMLAAAHGYELTCLGDDWKPLLPFARAALEDPDSEEELHRVLPQGGGMRTPWPDDVGWTEWTSPFRMPPTLVEHAVRAGLVVVVREGVRVAEPGASCPPERRRRAVERSMSILRGGWVEVALADAIASSPRFREIRWSVEAEEPRPMEHDVLALKGSTLVLASAKRSMQPGMFAHLREVRAHASRLGGARAIAALCIGRLDRGRLSGERADLASDLAEVADALGVRIIDRAALLLRSVSAL
jgi:hypothetical protein